MNVTSPTNRTSYPIQENSPTLHTASTDSRDEAIESPRAAEDAELPTSANFASCHSEPADITSPKAGTSPRPTTVNSRSRHRLQLPTTSLSASLNGRRLRTLAKRGPTGCETLRTTQIMKRDLLYGRSTIVTEQQLLWLEQETRNEDYDTDLEEEKKPPQAAANYAQVAYRRQCRKLHVAPSSYLERNFCNKNLSMRHHSLGPKRAKAIAVPLQMNHTIESLDLEDNDIQSKGVKRFVTLIEENEAITRLNLADNNLETNGAAHLYPALVENTCLQSLNLSGNKFTDNAATYLFNIIASNKYLQEINLSRNQLSERAGSFLGKALEKNDTLEVLDLSWNHIRSQSAEDFARGLKKNRSLLRLCMAYNGIGDLGARAIASAVASHRSLQELDLSGNRIGNTCLEDTAAAFSRSRMLTVLRLGHNPLTTADCATLLTTFQSQPKSKLSILDFSDVVVDQNFVEMVREVTAGRKRSLQVIFGHVRRISPFDSFPTQQVSEVF